MEEALPVTILSSIIMFFLPLRVPAVGGMEKLAEREDTYLRATRALVVSGKVNGQGRLNCLESTDTGEELGLLSCRVEVRGILEGKVLDLSKNMYLMKRHAAKMMAII